MSLGVPTLKTNQSPGHSKSTPVTAYIVVLIAIATTSSAAILIRFALDENMPPVLIVAARLLIASLVLTPLTARSYLPTIAGLSRKELLLIAISGICLAVHFTAWVTSLQYTTVLVSVVVVSTGPIWVAILEVIFLKISLSRLVVAGLIVALIGGAMIGFPLENTLASSVENGTLTGALLAWVGALSLSVYMLIGRKMRARLPVIPYVWLVYGIATLFMLAIILISATPVLGFSMEGYLILLAMGLVPQLLGHSSFNYLLEYFPAALVSMFSQLEPIGSAVLALILFREMPPNQQIVGSLIIIVGVIMASRGEIRPSRENSKSRSGLGSAEVN